MLRVMTFAEARGSQNADSNAKQTNKQASVPTLALPLLERLVALLLALEAVQLALVHARSELFVALLLFGLFALVLERLGDVLLVEASEWALKWALVGVIFVPFSFAPSRQSFPSRAASWRQRQRGPFGGRRTTCAPTSCQGETALWSASTACLRDSVSEGGIAQSDRRKDKPFLRAPLMSAVTESGVVAVAAAAAGEDI